MFEGWTARSRGSLLPPTSSLSGRAVHVFDGSMVSDEKSELVSTPHETLPSRFAADKSTPLKARRPHLRVQQGVGGNISGSPLRAPVGLPREEERPTSPGTALPSLSFGGVRPDPGEVAGRTHRNLRRIP